MVGEDASAFEFFDRVAKSCNEARFGAQRRVIAHFPLSLWERIRVRAAQVIHEGTKQANPHRVGQERNGAAGAGQDFGV